MTFGQEIEYMRLINGLYKLDIQQKILLVSAMRHPFESMPKNNKKDR